MKTLLTSITILLTFSSLAQNVGIGTDTPSEKLDVNGNLNVVGQIKINGNGGSSGQVLMKDNDNNVIWGDVSRFKNVVAFDCFNIAGSSGASNCSFNWAVPAGVTQIFVQMWAGGGGGGTVSGGGAGGYNSAIIAVTPGTSYSIQVGAGGNYGSVSSAGISGGVSSINFNGSFLTAVGGVGGGGGNLFTISGVSPAAGGSYSSGLTGNVVGLFGEAGKASRVTFGEAAANDFARIAHFGDGGDAPLFPGSGGKGGYRISSTSFNTNINASTYGSAHGAGGGADNAGGFYGRGGRVLIRY
jgi:hypothetical protein